LLHVLKVLLHLFRAVNDQLIRRIFHLKLDCKSTFCSRIFWNFSCRDVQLKFCQGRDPMYR
jgi:hypothetical protein